MKFIELKRKVRANFDQMANAVVLFYVDIDRDVIWDKYLSGFITEEEKQGHNCNSCKSFLRQYAGIVGIVDGVRVSIWDNLGHIPEEFVDSMTNIQDYIKSRPITDVFLSEHAKCGVDNNKDGIANTIWNHFYIHLPSKFVVKNEIDKKRGDLRENRNMLRRALMEITVSAVNTVLELIASNSIYRGREFERAVREFSDLQQEYQLVTEDMFENFVWVESFNQNIGVVRLRNTVIGTLLVDLSKGEVSLDVAVEKYETKVSAGSYKRPTALVTPRMIEDAKAKLTEMGLLDSLDRRHAEPEDIATEDLLFIDKSSGAFDAFDDMTKESSRANIKLGKVDDITIESFIRDVLPTAKKVEMLVENNQINRFVTLIAAQNMDAPTLFKWNNPFSWSYTKGLTDVIKERVKAAGGQIVGELRNSLSWSNYDDLDIWVITPSGFKIFYNKPLCSISGGKLDVDMNASTTTGPRYSRTPVENIIFPTKHSMEEGEYTVKVNNFNRRESGDKGYTIQIECQGEITEIHKEKSPSHGATHTVCKYTYSKTNGLTFDKEYSTSRMSKDVWGLKTNTFVKVNQFMLSPNFWGDNNIGNKHYMFMLEDCVCDEEPKPFFNEFLNGTFDANRKVFEVMNSKFRVEPELNQVSGIGFSETIPGEVTLRVTGAVKRTLKIKF